jgi:hypothetical protein
MHTKFWLENLKGRDYLEGLGVDDRSELTLWKKGGKVWNEIIWLRTGISGGLL